MSRKKRNYLVYLLTLLSLVSGINFICNFSLAFKSLAVVLTLEKQPINRENINLGEFQPSPNTGALGRVTRTASTGTRYVPPDRGAPSSTGGGATRGLPCEQDQKIPSLPLTALRPDNSLAGGVGLTLESQPQFLVYMPQTSAESAEFTLQDQQRNNVYQSKFTIKGQPGIISISLPKNAIQLENNKNYTWYTSIICDRNNRTKDVTVAGWIKREVPPTNLANQLQNAAARERPRIYAENSIWHEAIANLAELINQNPNDPTLMNEWKTLLESAKIQGIGEKPFRLTKIELPPQLAVETRRSLPNDRNLQKS